MFNANSLALLFQSIPEQSLFQIRIKLRFLPKLKHFAEKQSC